MVELFKDLGGVVGPALLILLGLISEGFRQLWKTRREQRLAKLELDKELIATQRRADDLARETIREAERVAEKERDRAQDVLKEAEKIAREERDYTQKLLDREREDRQREIDSRQRESETSLHLLRNKLQSLTDDLALSEKRAAMAQAQHTVDLDNMKQRLAEREIENGELKERVAYLEKQLQDQRLP